ncbi:MAG: DUF1345 domain-containing protein [Dokdonella sp.]
MFVLILTGLLATGFEPARSILLAFDVAAIGFLAATAHLFASETVVEIRKRAQQEDASRWGILWSSVVVSLVVLVALGLELHGGKSGRLIEIVLAASCILLAWVFMNTMFALHYAHEYYGDTSAGPTREVMRKGLEFPGKDNPDYWDFAYFAFVVGMTFQVSDVQISGRHLRRLALGHSVIAFFFNVIILALSVNVVAGSA